jgi:3-hydroxyisobutyrate dehydrogenase-like beta-hydroxyacid dehydrogenase
MQRVGLIGLGNVGSGFARKLREAAYALSVFDPNLERVRAAAELGARPAGSPAQVAEQSDVVLLSLPGSHVVEAVMEGEEGILSRLQAGQLVVDTGTSRPETDIRYQQVCAERGAGFLDAPITGRSAGWIMMVGGAAKDFERGREVLTCLSYKLKHVGPAGSGQMLKLANQLVLAGQWAVWAEAIEFARGVGLDPQLLSDYLEFPVPAAMYGDDFAAGGQLALHYKDLGYILEVAHQAEANIPVTGLVHEIFKAARAGGDPTWSQPGIVTYWRRLNQRRGGGA